MKTPQVPAMAGMTPLGLKPKTITVGKSLLSDHAPGARICPKCGGPKLPDLGFCETCIKASWND